jgi:hypothetical protein
MDADGAKTNAPDADSEIAWSRSPDAGIKPCDQALRRDPQGDGG